MKLDRIQTMFYSMGKSGCLALDYVAAAKIIHDNIHNLDVGCSKVKHYGFFYEDLFGGLIRAIESDTVDSDGWVKDPNTLISLQSNYNVVVEKVAIKSLDEIKDELYCANFTYNGYNHWVLCYNNEIIFDSLNDSKCVKFGKPTSARVIHIKG